MPRGGKRPGAGRKVGSTTRKAALKAVFDTPPASAEQPGTLPDARAAMIGRLKRDPKSGPALAVKAADVLATVDEIELWQMHLFCEDSKVAFWALQYLTDRRDGKPRQAMELTGTGGGPIQLMHSVPRPTRLDGHV